MLNLPCGFVYKNDYFNKYFNNFFYSNRCMEMGFYKHLCWTMGPLHKQK